MPSNIDLEENKTIIKKINECKGLRTRIQKSRSFYSAVSDKMQGSSVFFMYQMTLDLVEVSPRGDFAHLNKEIEKLAREFRHDVQSPNIMRYKIRFEDVDKVLDMMVNLVEEGN